VDLNYNSSKYLAEVLQARNERMGIGGFVHTREALGTNTYDCPRQAMEAGSSQHELLHRFVIERAPVDPLHLQASDHCFPTEWGKTKHASAFWPLI
jgi:hypothetical protein